MLPGKYQHNRSLTIACVLCTVVILALQGSSSFYRELEWKACDQLSSYGRKAPLHPDIVLLAVDNASITKDLVVREDNIEKSEALKIITGGWPYNRAVYPLIIERLLKAGAKVVAFDMLFTSEKPEDPEFAAALERYSDRVVIGANIEQRDQAEYVGDERVRNCLVPPAESLIPPVLGMDSRLGFVNFWPDVDGFTVNKERLVVRRSLYRTTNEEVNELPRSEDSREFLSLSSRMLEKGGYADRIPLSHQKMLFRYSEKIRPISLIEIFIDNVWEKRWQNGEFFRNKIVLVGPVGNWAKDELLTPQGPTLGPLIHISALNAALQKDFLWELPRWADAALIVLGGVVAWLLGRFLRAPMLRFVLLLTLAISAYAFSLQVYDHSGLLPFILSPMLALLASGGSFSVAEQVLDRLEKARFRRTFERYVSRDVVKELLDNPQSYLNTLGGARKDITVLFSDVRGFTTITESADPHELVAQLNEYFNEMVEIVFSRHGTLDKFIGDAVMAQWGGIVSEGIQTDARRAVSTAVQMRRSLVKLNEGWKARGMIELKFGIGVNHGAAIVGNLGCAAKTEVTAIGDAVNLASRLESATKEYNTDLLLGEGMAPLVRDVFFLRSAGLLQVKGKTRPVEVFTVLEEDRTESTPQPEWLTRYEEGIVLYRDRQFAAAIEAFSASLVLRPDDWLTQSYIDGSRALLAVPPPEDWDGVLVMTSK